MTLIQALMNAEDCSEAEAKEIIKEMQDDVVNGEDPEEILLQYGLEPDYVFEILIN